MKRFILFILCLGFFLLTVMTGYVSAHSVNDLRLYPYPRDVPGGIPGEVYINDYYASCQVVYEGEPINIEVSLSQDATGGYADFYVSGFFIGSAPIVGTSTGIVTTAIKPGMYGYTAVHVNCYDKYGNYMDHGDSLDPFYINPTQTSVPGTVTGIILPSESFCEGTSVTITANLADVDGGYVDFYAVGTYLGRSSVVDKKAVITTSSIRSGTNFVQADYHDKNGAFVDSRSTGEFHVSRTSTPGSITGIFCSPSRGAQPYGSGDVIPAGQSFAVTVNVNKDMLLPIAPGRFFAGEVSLTDENGREIGYPLPVVMDDNVVITDVPAFESGTHIIHVVLTDSVGDVVDKRDLEIVVGQPSSDPSTDIPEFPSITLPIVAVLGIIFVFSRKRNE